MCGAAACVFGVEGAPAAFYGRASCRPARVAFPLEHGGACPPAPCGSQGGLTLPAPHHRTRPLPAVNPSGSGNTSSVAVGNECSIKVLFQNKEGEEMLPLAASAPHSTGRHRGGLCVPRAHPGAPPVPFFIRCFLRGTDRVLPLWPAESLPWRLWLAPPWLLLFRAPTCWFPQHLGICAAGRNRSDQGTEEYPTRPCRLATPWLRPRSTPSWCSLATSCRTRVGRRGR